MTERSSHIMDSADSDPTRWDLAAQEGIAEVPRANVDTYASGP